MALIGTYKIRAGLAEYFPGSLLSLLPELRSPAQIECYLRAPLGWSVCPLGFSIYKLATNLEHIVIPGVHPPEGPTPKRKFPNYNLRFSKSQVEAAADELRAFSEVVDAESASLIGNLTHDLRALSGQIYNAAEMLKIHLNASAYSAAAQKSDTVIAAQQMLSLRLDMLDYSTGLALEKDPERIPVYKKYDKVVKCFESEALFKELKLDIFGPSSGYTFGAPVFELVPFVLVENAVKYAPRRSTITVKITDFEKHIDAHVQSFGPRISKAELPRLFEQGFRGDAARATGKSGSGVGLYAAKSLLRGSFNGDLQVAQDAVAVNIDAVEVWRTTFSCRVPRVA